jgi:hypothetical protein
MINNFIVTTTIFKPSVALKKFLNINNWQLIVVGDKKTPHNLYKEIKKIIYLSPEDQEKIDKKLSDLIGWNCIQRRNFGYILAYKLGVKYIATVDDDNIPLQNWGKNIYLDKNVLVDSYNTNLLSFDPLSIFKNKIKIWHRGFPLQLIQEKANLKKKKVRIIADIQANLWNGNPDIDAINRLNLNNENFYFSLKNPYTSNKIMPFNSQNTILTRNVIKHYFLFPHIGRMDDIWAAFYVQSIGKKVIFSESTVKQERNPHNLYTDFKNELIGYNNNLNLINSLYKSPLLIKNFLPKKSYEAFKQYQKNFS